MNYYQFGLSPFYLFPNGVSKKNMYIIYLNEIKGKGLSRKQIKKGYKKFLHSTKCAKNLSQNFGETTTNFRV